MADIKISELERVQSLNNGDLVEVSQEDSYSETGYSSKSAKMTDLGEKVVNGIEYTSELNTSNKKIIGAINEIASYTPVYGNTASGAIATFDTSLALPLQDCTIAINAVQESGTPTPSSPKAISGFDSGVITRCGVNLWNEDWELGAIRGSDGADVGSSSQIRSVGYISVKPNITYRVVPTSTLNIFFYDANKNYIDFVPFVSTITTPANCYYIRFSTKSTYGTTYNNDISINYPSTDTDYHAYNGTTVTISLGQTVYGGSLDVTSGKLTVTHKHITFDFTSSSDIGGGYSRKTYALGDDRAVYPTSESNQQICNVAPWKASFAEQSTHFYCSSTHCNVILPSDTPTSTTIEVVYELLTPVTYQLTPTQISAIVGTNNVFTDTNGDTSVVYACSLKDYIDGQ